MRVLSRVQLFATPWAVACQATLSREFLRQEYWSGLPFPTSGDLPNPGIEPWSPSSQADSLPSEPLGKHWQAGSLPLAPPGRPKIVRINANCPKCD